MATSTTRRIFLLLALLLPSGVACAQASGQWSFAPRGGYCIPLSYGMTADPNELLPDLANDFEARRFPFHDRFSNSWGYGAELGYRFPFSPFSAVAGFQHSVSTADITAHHGYIPQFTSLSAYTALFGAECTLGSLENAFNLFAQAGIALSLIGGYVDPYPQLDIPYALRGGLGAAVGARVNLGFLPVSLEARTDYLYANLVGKSFEAPSARPDTGYVVTFQRVRRALNDGKNPNDPGDPGREITYATFQFGVRVLF